MAKDNNSQSSDVQTQAPAVVDQGVQDTQPKVDVEQPVAVSKFQSKIDAMKTGGTQAQKILIASLEKYITDMAPGKPIANDAGARNQYNLWKAISFVVETAPVDEFKKLWNILLSFFEEHKNGVFGDRYVFRFSEYWLWSQHELNGLHRVLNIIKLTSNPAERAKGLKQVSLDRSLTEGFSDDARQKIITFYKG